MGQYIGDVGVTSLATSGGNPLVTTGASNTANTQVPLYVVDPYVRTLLEQILLMLTDMRNNQLIQLSELPQNLQRDLQQTLNIT